MVLTHQINPSDQLHDLAQKAHPNVISAMVTVLKTVSNHKAKSGAVTRMLLAIAEVTEELATGSLIEASGASSDLEVLLQVLEQPEMVAEMREHDPLAPSRLRALRMQRDIINAEGGVYSSLQVAEILNISRQAVDNRRKKMKLLGISLGRHGYQYPVWQFSESGVLPGIAAVLQILDGHGPWIQSAFLLNKNGRLNGERPIDELRRGNLDRVLKAARMYGEQTAT